MVTGVIDACVYALNHRRRNMDNPGNFGDCMKGPFSCTESWTRHLSYVQGWNLNLGLMREESSIPVICAPWLLPGCFIHRVRCIGDTPGHTQT